MRTAILEKRHNRFMSALVNSSIEKYFGIISKPNTSLRFTIEQINEEYILKTIFKKKYVFEFEQLPKEINDIIRSYTIESIIIDTKIFYGNNYPFSPPVWSLINVLENINISIDVKKYYNYIVEIHNNHYQHYWSPAIDIEMDILEFIQKINHFDYLLDY